MQRLAAEDLSPPLELELIETVINDFWYTMVVVRNDLRSFAESQAFQFPDK